MYRGGRERRGSLVVCAEIWRVLLVAGEIEMILRPEGTLFDRPQPLMLPLQQNSIKTNWICEVIG
jgi:hypothetical protein